MLVYAKIVHIVYLIKKVVSEVPGNALFGNRPHFRNPEGPRYELRRKVHFPTLSVLKRVDLIIGRPARKVESEGDDIPLMSGAYERGLWPGSSLIKKKLFTMKFPTMPGTALIAPRRPQDQKPFSSRRGAGAQRKEKN
jgi:hypothetical protein